MKILVIGADGQLGRDLAKVIPASELIPLTIKELDITDARQTEEVIARHRPAAVINTAAKHNTDQCEENELATFAVNTVGVKNVARACRAAGAKLVQLSTDYVFDGEKGSAYVESDQPLPVSIYGISKLAAEYCVQYLLADFCIVRTSGLYGVAGCLDKGRGNFVDNMIKRAASQPLLKIVDDEIVSPTYTRDLAEKIVELIEERATGTFHVTNSGHCSWYEFAREIFCQLGTEVEIEPVKSTAQVKARRPRFSALASQRLDKPLRPWTEALKAYLVEKKHLQRS